MCCCSRRTQLPKEDCKGKADYLLCVKDNHKTLKQDIEEYIKDEELRNNMSKETKTEKNRGRIEKRTGYVTNDISWLYGREEWEGLKSIGAIHTEFEEKGKKSSEWHYYKRRNSPYRNPITTKRTIGIFRQRYIMEQCRENRKK